MKLGHLAKLLTVGGAILVALPGRADPLRLSLGNGTLLQAVVGEPFSVALPATPGFRWEWAAEGDASLFEMPYRVRYAPGLSPGQPSPEVWVFPLVRPGSASLEFRQIPQQALDEASSSATRSLTLHVLSPYEAQQHALGDLSSLVLLQ